MPKKALIAWGGWEGHTPERSANVIRALLELSSNPTEGSQS